jgi:hypothetical protein
MASQGLRWFESEAALVSYVTQRAYEDEGFTKVASAIVMHRADRHALKWEYAIRTNFTQNFEMDQPTVGMHHAPPPTLQKRSIHIQ